MPQSKTSIPAPAGELLPLLCQPPQFNRSGCWMPARHALLTLAGIGTLVVQ